MSEAIVGLNIQDYVADQIKFGATNIDILADIINHNLVPPEKAHDLSNAYMATIHDAFRRRFPGDAFRNLQALNIVAKNITPNEGLNLDNQWQQIQSALQLPQVSPLTVKIIYKYFLPLADGKYPQEKYEGIQDMLTTYLLECIRRAHSNNDISLLHKVIPAMKVLGYFHKMKVGTQYTCSDEFNTIARFGVDDEHMGFRYMSKSETQQTGEQFY